MKRKHWIAIILLCMLGACSIRFFGGLRTYLYHGQVVDAENGTPLVNAAVTVVWYRAGVGIESHALSLLSAQETVTDASGRFSLQVSSGLDWNPLSTRDDEPMIVIYKPEYEPLWFGTQIQYGFKSNQLVESLQTGALIKLRTLEAAKKRSTSYTWPDDVLGAGGFSVPSERIPNLIRAINLQRAMAGESPYVDYSRKGNVP